MLQLILKTHLAFLLIPLLTLALEPNNPVTLCDRFVNDSDKAVCLEKINRNTSDWYASSACSLQEDDKNFLACLDEIKDGTYNPEALDLCAQRREASDVSRLKCLQKIKNKDYTRAQIKKCEENSTHDLITECLSSSPHTRTPASNAHQPGFQPLEIRH
jgi:hypothetical protein